MTPLQRYQNDLKKPGFIHDATQQQAIEKLQQLYDLLVEQQNEPSTGLLDRIGRVFGRQPNKTPIKGLYFWGGVGRGKTYLMDIFFEALPFSKKMRIHFHRFMRRVHQELKTLKQEKNPLDIVAQRFADETTIICFDEFFVSDITDAMILATLLDGLFKRGVTLVATSNIEPNGLYKDGLQRARFLPAIALLNQHTQVINVDGGTDYRLRALSQAELYHWPLDEQADQSLLKSFQDLVPDTHEIKDNTVVEIEGRDIPARYHGEDVVWFDFSVLCGGPRSQNDYIEIACEYHAVMLSNIPVLNHKRESEARRFINLVDEFYDRNVKLIITAEKPIDALYTGNLLSFEFERTQSRLLEMQSHQYLSREHRA